MVYLCACECVCMYVLYMCVYVSSCICMCVYVSSCICMCVYVSSCICMCVYVSSCICMCVYVSSCICMCVYMYMSLLICASCMQLYLLTFSCEAVMTRVEDESGGVPDHKARHLENVGHGRIVKDTHCRSHRTKATIIGIGEGWVREEYNKTEISSCSCNSIWSQNPKC